MDDLDVECSRSSCHIPAVLPVGRFSRTIGLFFSLRCEIFLLLRVAVFWASLTKCMRFLGCFFERFFY